MRVDILYNLYVIILVKHCLLIFFRYWISNTMHTHYSDDNLSCWLIFTFFLNRFLEMRYHQQDNAELKASCVMLEIYGYVDGGIYKWLIGWFSFCVIRLLVLILNYDFNILLCLHFISYYPVLMLSAQELYQIHVKENLTYVIHDLTAVFSINFTDIVNCFVVTTWLIVTWFLGSPVFLVKYSAIGVHLAWFMSIVILNIRTCKRYIWILRFTFLQYYDKYVTSCFLKCFNC